MRVGNFECQIAQSQIGRYLSGEALSQEALRQLNGHIGACADCKQTLDQRKAALLSMLAPGEAVVQMDDAPPATTRDRLRDQLTRAAAASVPAFAAPAVASAEPKTRTHPAKMSRPILYSLALAGVMLAMSYLAKNPATLFGEKAATALPETTTPPVSGAAALPVASIPGATEVAAAISPTPEAVSVAAQDSTSAPSQAEVGNGPAPEGAASPAPSAHVSRPKAAMNPPQDRAPAAGIDRPSNGAVRQAQPPQMRRTPRTSVRRPVRRPPPSRPGIRVYDPAGRPINP
ncbi:MAG TPA: hypothetical protein VM328_01520 [Fimbriimonadaceae bacterium]|nr:hypothetical protein [Fimbriimonadaceae bacterium]